MANSAANLIFFFFLFSSLPLLSTITVDFYATTRAAVLLLFKCDEESNSNTPT